VFDYCPFIGRKCSHAGYHKGELHCGIKNGSLIENKVKNMNKCPKKDKNEKRHRK
tara:strand:- start:247 stop:411 length:165 start_codon:yes stop_codon:yes gene_type:complete